MEGVYSSVIDIGERFGALADATSRFNRATPYGQMPYMEKMYTVLNNYQISWGKTYLEQLEYIKKHYHDFFRYHTKTNDVLKDYIRQRNSLFNLYTEANKKLDEKKEKLFLGKQTDKWDIPLNMKDKAEEL